MRLIEETASDKEVKSRVLAQQIELLYRNQTFAILVTTIIGAIAFLYISVEIDWVDLKTPFIIFVFAMTLRLFSSHRYYSAKKKNRINLLQAESYYLIGIVATGVFWCVSTLSLFPLLDLKGQVLLIIVITGFATGAQTTMGYLRVPVSFFLLLLLIPLVYVIYYSDLAGSKEIAITVVFYTLFLLRSSLMFYKNTYDMLLFQEISVDRETELIRQKEKANSANQAKTQFLSRMSHELRTPLNAILGFAELQLRDKSFPLSEKQISRTHKISDAGNHLLSLVNDVLDFSRIETGSMELNLEETNLFEVVSTSMRLFENKALRRKINISAEKDQLSFAVMADKNRLKQVLVNLLDNAIKFNKVGGNVSIYADVTRRNRVRLYVEDTGFGIRDGNPDELFLPFSRLKADVLGVDGTGIGLSLCKELIELMQGDIGFDRDTTEGCRFWIELPHVANSKVLTDNNVREDRVLDAVSAMKVLLVEDNLVNSEVAVDILAVINVDADIANNGQEALELFRKYHYPLVLMDCEMPVMNGFETTEELRKIESQQEVQLKPAIIVALTAHAVSGAKDKCLESGMDDFLSKPFSMNDLHSMVYKWLDIGELNKAKPQSLTDDCIEEEVPNNGLVGTKLVIDQNILDHETLLKLVNRQTGSGGNFLSKVVGIYLEQSSRLFNDLKNATNESDVEAVRVIAHTLKSSSVNVGALVLSDVCRTVEISCEGGVIEQSAINELYQRYSEVKAELTNLMKKIQS